MGFHATDTLADRPKTTTGRTRLPWNRRPVKTTTPRKNRVWNFFATFTTSAWKNVSQVVEPHQETFDTSTITVSGVLFYGFRFYSPQLGRWLSRDPIGEFYGQINLYCIAGNTPITGIDVLGLLGVPTLVDYMGGGQTTLSELQKKWDGKYKDNPNVRGVTAYKFTVETDGKQTDGCHCNITIKSITRHYEMWWVKAVDPGWTYFYYKHEVYHSALADLVGHYVANKITDARECPFAKQGPSDNCQQRADKAGEAIRDQLNEISFAVQKQYEHEADALKGSGGMLDVAFKKFGQAVDLLNSKTVNDWGCVNCGP